MALRVKESYVLLENGSFVPTFHCICQPQLNSHLSLSNSSLRNNTGLMVTDASDWPQNHCLGQGWEEWNFK